MAQLNDKQGLRRLGVTRRQLLEQVDRPALKDLPGEPYEYSEWRLRRVGVDYHVDIDAHYYSVPYRFARAEVEARLTACGVEIFHKGEQIAVHLRVSGNRKHTTVPAHMPSSHRRYAGWTIERIREDARKIGPATAALCEQILESRPHPEQGYRACLGIVRLVGSYGAARVEAAAEHAIEIGARTYGSVKSILDAKLRNVKSLHRPDPQPESEPNRRLEFIKCQSDPKSDPPLCCVRTVALAPEELMMWTAPAWACRLGPERSFFDRHREGALIMRQIVRIGLDIAKRWFQVRAVDEADKEVFNRKLPRDKVLVFLGALPPCEVALEACSSSHYWGREIERLGHRVRLISPNCVKPFVKRGKSDAHDARAICEAASRPDMRFVPVKTEEQQAALMQHTSRQLLIDQRTAVANSLRSQFAEFGVFEKRGVENLADLVRRLDENDPDLADIPQSAHAVMRILADHLRAVEAHLTLIDEQIEAERQSSAAAQALETIPGIGALISAALAAHVPDPSAFRSGRDFAAWLGLVPRQNSSGGKDRLGRITKQGNPYLRRLLVLGATASLRWLHKRNDPLAVWTRQLLRRRPARLVTVALANKLARIAWAIMTTGERYRREAPPVAG